MKLILIFLSLWSSVAAETDVYLAGPLFTMAERQFNAELAGKLRELGISVFLPQEEEAREFTAECIFAQDVEGINGAKRVVAIMDGPDPDSGTAWECGYAYGKGKPVIVVRTDFRSMNEGLAPYNLMLWMSAKERVQISSLKCGLAKLAEEIYSAIARVDGADGKKVCN